MTEEGITMYCWTNEDLFWVKMICDVFINSIFANAGVGKKWSILSLVTNDELGKKYVENT